MDDLTQSQSKETKRKVVQLHYILSFIFIFVLRIIYIATFRNSLLQSHIRHSNLNFCWPWSVLTRHWRLCDHQFLALKPTNDPFAQIIQLVNNNRGKGMFLTQKEYFFKMYWPFCHLSLKFLTTSSMTFSALAFSRCSFTSSSTMFKKVKQYTFSDSAKKVISDSLGQVDFAIGLVNPVVNLPNGQVKFSGRIQITEVL